MGDLTLARFLRELLSQGIKIELEYLGGGGYTNIELRRGDTILSMKVPTPSLDCSDDLIELKENIAITFPV